MGEKAVEEKNGVVMVVLSIIVMSIPIWWMTTSVQQSPLPHQHIARVSTLPIPKCPFTLVLWGNDTPLVHHIVSVFKSTHLKWMEGRTEYHLDLNIVSGKERVINDGDNQSLDIEVDNESENEEISMQVSESNTALLSLPKGSSATTVKRKPLVRVFHLLRRYVLEAVVPSLGANPQLMRSAMAKASPARQYHDRLIDQHRVKESPQFLLSFSFLNADPSTGQGPLGWDFDFIQHQQLGGLIDKLGVVADIRVDGQMTHFSGIASSPKQWNDKENNRTWYTFDADQVQHFVRLDEWDFGFSTRDDPILNFVVYVPPADIRPLSIRPFDGNNLQNWVVLPRWGTVYVHNPENGETSMRQSDMIKACSVFVNHIRAAFGLSMPNGMQTVFANGLLTLQHSPVGINDWELDALMRSVLVRNVKSSTATLQSFVNIVEKIPNMAIPDDITNTVDKALNSIHVARNVSLGIEERVWHSRMALEAAEKAFFDARVLAQLFFPEDHKIAVYLPLFGPISVPIIVAIKKMVDRWRKKRNEEDE